MEDILVKMGMTNMLDPLKADFTIISLYKKLFVSGIIHRAIIEVKVFLNLGANRCKQTCNLGK